MTIPTFSLTICLHSPSSSRARAAACLLAAVAATCATTSPLRAGLSDSGDVAVDGADQLLIGNANPGSHFNSASIESYADIEDGIGAVGSYTLSSGSVSTVNFIGVGYQDTGSLNANNSAIASGSQIFLPDGLIAVNADIGRGGAGSVLLNNSSWQVVGGMAVGDLSGGSLSLTGTSTINADYFYVGYQANGTVTATDPDISIVANAAAVIGYFGAANVTLDAGASLSTGSDLISIGESTDSFGTLMALNNSTVSVADGAGYLAVGRVGHGVLDIESGAIVTDGYSILGEGANAVGTVLLDGEGSRWITANDLTVGSAGTGFLTVKNNALLQTVDGIIGDKLGSNGSVEIGNDTGTPVTWDNSAGFITIANAGTGYLTVFTGGNVTTQQIILAQTGDPENPSTGTLIINGGTVTASSYISVGRGGIGILTVTNGGHLDSVDGLIGEQLGSDGQVTIGDSSGNLSLWNNNDGFITIGNEGTGNVTVLSDGKITTAQLILGAAAGTGDPAIPGIGTLSIDGGSVIASDFASVGELGIGHLLHPRHRRQHP